MADDHPLCRRCCAAIMPDESVVFPERGVIEHLSCPTQQRVSRVRAPGLRCLACEEPLLPGEEVVLVGYELIHATCHHGVRTIGGASGPAARPRAQVYSRDPFAAQELLVMSRAIRLDAADVRACSRYMRERRSARRTFKRTTGV